VLGVVAPVVAVDAIVELGILALCIALILLRKAWVSTFGALLSRAASAFDSASIKLPVIGYRIGFNWIGDILRWVDGLALNVLGEGVLQTEHAAKTLWHWTAYMAEETARVIGDLAESTWGELHYLRRWKIPALIALGLLPFGRQIEWLIAQVRQLVAHPHEAVRQAVRVLDPRVGGLERRVDRLAQQVASLAAGAIVPPLVIPRLPSLDVLHGIDEIRARLGKVARILTPAGAIGLVAAVALEGLGLGWLKCRGVGRVGRELCGLGGLLEELASDVIEALVVADLCEFTVAVAYAAKRFEPVLLDLVDVESALIGCHGATAARPLRIASSSPTPVLEPLALS